MPYRGMPGITKGYRITGGPESKAYMAQGTINDVYGQLRAKSAGIAQIPSKQQVLDAELEVAKEQAKTLETKAEWDSKTLGAKFDADIGGINSAANSNLLSGALRGAAGVGLGAFKLFSGNKGGDTTDTSSANSFSGNWNEMSDFVKQFDFTYGNYGNLP